MNDNFYMWQGTCFDADYLNPWNQDTRSGGAQLSEFKASDCVAALTSSPLLIVTRYILIRINLTPGKNCSCSNCATVGDDDSFLEFPRRRAQGFDFFNEIHTLNDFACK